MLLAFATVLLAAEPALPASPAPATTSAENPRTLTGADPVAAVADLEALSLRGGDGALEAIADYLEHWKGDPEMERRGHSALRRLPVDPASISRVIRESDDPARRAWAAWTAGEHQAAGAADALLAALADPDARVRLRAVAALGVIGDPRAHEPILKMVVHEKDPATRERAERALAALATPRADPEPLEPQLEALASEDVFRRLEAMKELVERADRRAVGPVLRALQHERDLEIRKQGVFALAAMKDEIAVPTLIEIAQKDHVEVRRLAVGALATLDDSRAVAPLVSLTRDPDWSVRRFSVRALAFLGRPGAADAILPAVGDMVPDVRAEALRALARLAPPGAADAFAKRLSVEVDPTLREQLAAGLGDLGRPGEQKHVEPLVALLEDPEPRIRATAAGALSKIGTKRNEKAIERMLERERKRKQAERDAEVLRIGEDALRMVRARGDEG